MLAAPVAAAVTAQPGLKLTWGTWTISPAVVHYARLSAPKGKTNPEGRWVFVLDKASEFAAVVIDLDLKTVWYGANTQVWLKLEAPSLAAVERALQPHLV